MKKIDTYNYEAYLLDFSEGNLTDKQISDLELFAILNPQFEINLNDLEFDRVDVESIHFSEKTKLKKTELDLVSENQFVAYIENQLNESERKHVDLCCATNQGLANELILFKKSIIIADDFMVYPNPNELKRKHKLIWFNFSPTQFAAAASLVLFIGLVFLFRNYTPTLKSDLTAVKINGLETKINIDYPLIKKKKIVLTNNKAKIGNQNLKAFTNSNQISVNNITGLAETIIQNKVVDTINIQNSIVAEKTKLNTINNVDETVAQTEVVEVLSNNVNVIIENKSQENSIKQNKYSIWAIASRTLNRLNKIGIKYVNGSEIANKEYALSLGRLSVKHHKAQEN